MLSSLYQRPAANSAWSQCEHMSLSHTLWRSTSTSAWANIHCTQNMQLGEKGRKKKKKTQKQWFSTESKPNNRFLISVYYSIASSSIISPSSCIISSVRADHISYCSLSSYLIVPTVSHLAANWLTVTRLKEKLFLLWATAPFLHQRTQISPNTSHPAALFGTSWRHESK